MKSLCGFKCWLIESILQHEATMRFSQKFRDQDVNNVPPGFWQWLLRQMQDQPNWTPNIEDDDGRRMSRDGVVKLAQSRSQSAQRAMSQPQQPQQPQTSSAPWILAKVINVQGLTAGEHVILTKSPNNDWVLMNRSGDTKRVPAAEIRTAVASVRDENNTPYQSANPEDLWRRVPEEASQKEQPPSDGRNPHLMDREKLSDEQKQIDQQFEQMTISPKQNHMMISALAGTGKTTVLKHLAWKYGKPGQKWLYLVFNTKNRVEAKETSGGFRKFPEWVDIFTTNSFLGRVMNSPENLTAFPQTDRMTSIQTDDGKKLEKARMIVDGSTFAKLMTDSYHLPDWDKQKDKVAQLLNDYGIRNEAFNRSGNRSGGKDSFFTVCMRTIESIIGSIRYNFKERVITLLGLLKSFSVDPRNKESLSENIRKVFDKYDAHTNESGQKTSGYFDTHLEDVKERISKYSPNFRNTITSVLDDLLNYNFMGKNFKEEVVAGARWMLEQSMPKATKEKASIKMKNATRDMNVDLGDYRDFNDDIWFPTIHADKVKFPHYDIVLADEVQDFNEGQKIMLKKLAESGAKIVAVGDRNQCHPAGTLIEMTGGIQKSIEELEIGDQVVTYNSKKDRFPGVSTQGRKVLKIAKRAYKGNLLTIETKSAKLKCTPNHKCLVRYINNPESRCLYLMVKGESARVGICPIGCLDALGLTRRVNSEKADKAWILDIFNSRQEAQIAEIKTSHRFGLPQLVFQRGNRMKLTQEMLNEIYLDLGNLHGNARKCLEFYGRMWDYPVWEKGKQERHGELLQNYTSHNKTFLTQACNLISGHMQMRAYQEDHGGDWETINLTSDVADCDVYSLSVEPTELNRRLYIANGLVVSNSIYRFRGADSSAFDNLADTLKDLSADKENWKASNLSLNFRSRPEVLNFVNDQTHVKDLKAGKKFKDGDMPANVSRGKVTYEDSFKQLSQERASGEKIETAFIARTNEPLVHAALKLLGKGIPFVILGKDVSGDLIKHVNKMIAKEKGNIRDDTPAKRFADVLMKHEEDERNKNSKYSTKKEYLANLSDTTLALTNTIAALTGENQNATVRDYKKWLQERLGSNTFDFDQNDERESERDLADYRQKMEKEKPVVLTTSHKSKGMEYSRVYILRDDQFPHPRAKHPEEKGQEANSKYVAYTRAMNQLHILDLKDQPGA